jgi:hypothetical protein
MAGEVMMRNEIVMILAWAKNEILMISAQGRNDIGLGK